MIYSSTNKQTTNKQQTPNNKPNNKEREKTMDKNIKQFKTDYANVKKQIKQIKKMGSFSGLLKMLPGFGKYANQVDDNELIRIESMIYSMTEEERRNPRVLNASRRIRIANGSGTSVQEINKFIKAFESTRDIMKKVKSRKDGSKNEKLDEKDEFARYGFAKHR